MDNKDVKGSDKVRPASFFRELTSDGRHRLSTSASNTKWIAKIQIRHALRNQERLFGKHHHFSYFSFPCVPLESNDFWHSKSLACSLDCMATVM